jgi:hypothetical protein
MRFPAVLLLAALVASGCADDTEQATAPASTAAAGATTTAAVPACAPGDIAEEQGSDTISGSANVANLAHPLLAELTVETDDDLLPAVHLVGPSGTLDLPVPATTNTQHTVLLVGMRADSDYTVEIDLLDESCGIVGRLDSLTLTTGSLPADLPKMTGVEADADRMAPGFTMFNLIDLRADFGATETPDGEVPESFGWIVIADAAGEIVWFFNEDHPLGDVRMLDDGTILYEFNDTGARRINLRGELLEEWAGTVITGRYFLDAYGRQVVGDAPTVVDVDAMHHEHNVLPDGTHATLSTEVRTLDGFSEPQCLEDPSTFDGTYNLIGDIVVIFDPESGEVLEKFNLFDYYDPRDDPAAFNLCGLPFDFVFPNWLYNGIHDEVRDWTHANAVEVDEANNTILVSIRHLDTVLALRWKDDDDGEAGEVLWESGPHGDLELLNGDWHLHQHAPEVQADGTILMYDNGNDRPGRGTEEAPLYSRAVLYDIDPDAHTIEQTWEYRSNREGELLFAAFVGDADRLDNGNVLITNGGMNGAGGLSAQIVEVVPRLPDGGDVVFNFEVDGGAGWIVYRAERIPSLFG